jgi:mono/diheme cytochrome c family protein
VSRAVLALALLVAAGAARADVIPPPPTAAQLAKKVERGKKLFAANCVKCHEADGRGQGAYGKQHAIPDFTKPEFAAKHSDTDLTATIITGDEEADMPAFGKQLSSADVGDLVAFIRQLSGPAKK